MKLNENIKINNNMETIREQYDETLEEVERLIESINGCNGLCDNSNITSNTNGCGCSK